MRDPLPDLARAVSANENLDDASEAMAVAFECIIELHMRLDAGESTDDDKRLAAEKWLLSKFPPESKVARAYRAGRT